MLRLLGDSLTPQQQQMLIRYFEEKDMLRIPTYNQYFYIKEDSSETSSSAVGY